MMLSIFVGVSLRFRPPFLEWCIKTAERLSASRGLVLTIAGLALLLFCYGVRAADRPPLDIVVDQAVALSADENASLRSKLAAFEREHQISFIVVIMTSTAPNSIEERARYLANLWQIGHNYQGRGILLLVALQDRRYRLEVSTALVNALTNAEAKELLALHLSPALRDGRYGLAVAQLLDVLGTHFAKRRTVSVESTSTTTVLTRCGANCAEKALQWPAVRWSG